MAKHRGGWNVAGGRRERPRIGRVLLTLAVAVLPAALSAQQAADRHNDAPVARTARSSGLVEIDGRLDESAWSGAPPITAFTQIQPAEGAPASEATEVRLLHDRDALYIGAVLHARQGISSRLARRDQSLPDSDWFGVALDTHHDHRTAYRLRVNPSGVKGDAAVSAAGEDPSWDPVWDVQTIVSDTLWSVEIRIPFSQLRFGTGPEQVWGIQIEREIAARQERALFAFTPRRQSGGVPRYGHLVGLSGIDRGRGVDLLPHLSARGAFLAERRNGDGPLAHPFHDGSDFSGDVGLDVKVRLASNLTLDAAINPDFGQVEVDPAVVNLTQYETRFDEKRPFFIEGAGIFQFGEGTELLHSRRIGEAPAWSAPGTAVHEDTPAAATILGAAKLTGRTAGGWSIGLLDAVTGEEHARYMDGAGVVNSVRVAPYANYAAARAQRSSAGDRTSLGVMATSVHRTLSGDPLEDRLPSAAYAGGVDFAHRWSDYAWSLAGHLAASRVEGTARAIERMQGSSARYFGRQDADHLALDPAATRLEGYAANVRLTRHAGLHWRGRAQLSATSPGFEVNDAGFQSRADRVGTHMRLQYVEERPGLLLRQWSISGGPDAGWNFGGDRLATTLSAELNAQLLSYWTGEIRLDRDLAALDDRRTRGGPLTRGLASSRVSVTIDSDRRRAWALALETDHRWDEAGGSTGELELELSVRPAETWNLSLRPRVERNRETAHFIGSVADPLAIATFGRRYLFADLDEATVAVETRLNITFSPGLTLELFTQPFVAAAAFGSVSELSAPRTFSFGEYGREMGTVEREGAKLVIDPDGPAGAAAPFEVEDGDFTRRSLRGNVVLRWEWRPGSTMFVVWQQSRAVEEPFGEFDFGRQARGLLGPPPENTLMVKVSYWLGR